MAGLAACPAGRSRIRDLQSAWSAHGVTLPEAEIARAIRSLIARDIMAGDDQYRFAVDLQRLWLKQQRRLDWVKEEVSAVLPEWHAAVEGEQKPTKWALRPMARMIGLILAGVIFVTLAGLLAWHEWKSRRNAGTQTQPGTSNQAAKINPEQGSGEENQNSSDSGPTTDYTVPYLAQLYNFPTEFDGSGQSIGLIEFGGGYKETDLAAYFSGLEIAKPKVTWVSVDGSFLIHYFYISYNLLFV